MANFNKLIDLKFTTDKNTFEIKTPRHGAKPEIKISGNLTMGGFVSNFEIEVTNLFTDSISENSEIIVTAGYEGQMSAGIAGRVTSVYTASPGPDKVTVISCANANFDSWLNKTINLKLNAGFSLKEAIKKVSAALEFEEAEIDASVADKPCLAPLEVNGKCSEALKQIRTAFPGFAIVPNGNKLYVFGNEIKRSSAIVHRLPFLTQSPQFSGGITSIMSQWNPMIKPGDYVVFPKDFKKSGMGAIETDTMQVNTIQFSFATNSDDNEMTLTGTAVSQLKKG